MNNHQTMLAAIKAVCGQANLLAIPRVLVDFTGSLESALLLSQIIYWSERTANPDGWFYKSHAGWTAEICLSEYQLRKAVKRLVELGIVETALRRAPSGSPTCHYRMEWTVFSESFLKFLRNGKPSNCENQAEETAETLNTEITTETTGIEKEGGAVAPAARPVQEIQEIEQSLKLDTANNIETGGRNDNTGSRPIPMPGGVASREAKPKTPKHPAVEVYRRVTGRYPARGVEPLIQAAGIETEEQLQFWEQVICRYIACGWNPRNIGAMLEFYGRRELPGSRPHSKKSGGDNDYRSSKSTRGNSLSAEQRRIFGIDRSHNSGHNSGSR